VSEVIWQQATLPRTVNLRENPGKFPMPAAGQVEHCFGDDNQAIRLLLTNNDPWFAFG